MDFDDLPDIPCEVPAVAEVGQSWICPECARKFHYVLITLEPQMTQAEAWFTNEIG